MNKWLVILGTAAMVVILSQLRTSEVFVNDFLPAISTEYLESLSVDDELVSPNQLNILAFGDMMLGRYVRILMDRNGKDYIFEKLGKLKDIFPEEDLIFANLEGPIKGKGYYSETSMVFGFNEDIAPFIKEKGIDLVSITNNHAVDQGWDGVATTREALKNSNVGFCGHPSEADPESVYYGEKDDIKFAFICFNDVSFNLDNAKANELIKTVRPNVDYLIVSIHWGIEYRHKASKVLQINPAREFIESGADLIIGHHPHVVQNFEIYNGHFIFYSIGNFIFDQYWSHDTQEELALGISLEKIADKLQTTVDLFPMESQKSQPHLLSGEEKTKWLNQFINYGNYDEDVKKQILEGELKAFVSE